MSTVIILENMADIWREHVISQSPLYWQKAELFKKMVNVSPLIYDIGCGGEIEIEIEIEMKVEMEMEMEVEMEMEMEIEDRRYEIGDKEGRYGWSCKIGLCTSISIRVKTEINLLDTKMNG